MKLNAIGSILKAQKSIYICEGAACQWLGDGVALYAVYNLPRLTRENVFTLFDIAEDNRGKFYFHERELPTIYNFNDDDSTEELIGERSLFTIVFNGRNLMPLKTSQGMLYIDKKYLKPFADLPDGFELCTRTTESGEVYIAVKAGLFILGIIMPYYFNMDCVSKLKTLVELSALAWLNKCCGETAGNDTANDEEEETSCETH